MNKEIAELVLKRANGYCEKCGLPGDNFALHHRKLRSQGGLDEVSNLIAVHHECHNLGTDSIHLNPKIARVKGWIVPSWAMTTRYPLHHPSGEIVTLNNDGSFKRME